jgi:hypothetical protein
VIDHDLARRVAAGSAQVSRFLGEWKIPAAGYWTALAADAIGFHIALMDHLIQIPQVDRAWGRYQSHT